MLPAQPAEFAPQLGHQEGHIQDVDLVRQMWSLKWPWKTMMLS